MKWLFLALLPLAFNALATSCSAPVELRKGEAIVTLLFGDGKPMRGIEYLLLGANGASVYRSNDGRFPEVLYGVYSVEVSAPAFRGRRLGLAVNQSLNHVRITPENILDPCGVVERSLAGQVLRDSVDGELWVKAVSARGDYSREFALGPLG